MYFPPALTPQESGRPTNAFLFNMAVEPWQEDEDGNRSRVVFDPTRTYSDPDESGAELYSLRSLTFFRDVPEVIGTCPYEVFEDSPDEADSETVGRSLELQRRMDYYLRRTSPVAALVERVAFAGPFAALQYGGLITDLVGAAPEDRLLVKENKQPVQFAQVHIR